MTAKTAKTADRPSAVPATAMRSNSAVPDGEESDGAVSRDFSGRAPPLASRVQADGDQDNLTAASSGSSDCSGEGVYAALAVMPPPQRQPADGSSSSSEAAAETSEHSSERSGPAEPAAADASDSEGSSQSDGDARDVSEQQAVAAADHGSAMIAGERRNEAGAESSSAEPDSAAVSSEGDDDGLDAEDEGLAPPPASELTADDGTANGMGKSAMSNVEDDLFAIPAGALPTLSSRTIPAIFFACAHILCTSYVLFTFVGLSPAHVSSYAQPNRSQAPGLLSRRPVLLVALRTGFILVLPMNALCLRPAGLESLTIGAHFWAGSEDPRAAEADWLARRGPLAADWRAKRRAALKHSRAHSRKKPRR